MFESLSLPTMTNALSEWSAYRHRRRRKPDMSIQATHPYESGLDKNAANYVPLTPISFLLRSASVYPNRLAVVHGDRRYSWREVLERSRRLAAALTARGVRRCDTVAVMAPNIPDSRRILGCRWPGRC
jgi:non-ribosomal peptide synthetase component F